MARGSDELQMAGRQGVRERVLSKSRKYTGFRLKPQSCNDFAFASLYRRFRPFAGFCGFFHRDGTRYGTRREALGDVFRESRAYNPQRLVLTPGTRPPFDQLKGDLEQGPKDRRL